MSEELIQIVVEFILGGIIIAVLGFCFQRLSWQRATKHDLQVKNAERSHETLKFVSNLIDSRIYWTNQMITALKRGKDKEDYETIKKGFFGTVEQWNANLNFALASLEADFSHELRLELENDIGTKITDVASELAVMILEGPVNEERLNTLDALVTDVRKRVLNFVIKMMNTLSEKEKKLSEFKDHT
ncbi:MAG: hypothetical protein AAF494_02420 [Pseudomonadota bacterium]